MILLFAVDIQRGAIAVSYKGQVYPFTFRRAVIKGIVRYACFRDADLDTSTAFVPTVSPALTHMPIVQSPIASR